MKSLLRLAAVVGAMAITSTSHAAAQYNYSYTFGSGAVVSGSFTGDAFGNVVTNLSNITASLNDVAFSRSGSLYNASYQSGTNVWIFGTAQASFDGTQNNLMFIDVKDSQWQNNFTNAFVILGGQQAFAATSASYISDVGTAGWQMTAAVPEPATYALMLAGLGMLGVARRRSGAKQ